MLFPLLAHQKNNYFLKSMYTLTPTIETITPTRHIPSNSMPSVFVSNITIK